MGSRDYHEDQRVSRDLKDITRIREYCPITLFAEKKRKKTCKNVDHATQCKNDESRERQKRGQEKKTNQLTAASVAGTRLSSVRIVPSREFPMTLLRILFFLIDPAFSAATPMAGGALGCAHIA